MAKTILTALALVGLAACRPAVEAEIPCGQGGDLDCPTGFHCGGARVCVAGEPLPKVTLEVPGALSGATTLTATVSAPNGATGVTASLAAGGAATDLAPVVTWKDSTHRQATVALAVDTRPLADGPATLTLHVAQAAGPAADAAFALVIENQPPAVTLDPPGTGGFVHGPAAFAGRVSGDATVRATVAGLASPPPVSVVPGPKNADGTLPFGASFDSSLVADGSYVLEVTATDAAGRVGRASVGFTVENAETSLVDAASTPVSTAGPGSLALVFSKPLPAPPAVTSAHFTLTPDDADASGARFTFGVRLKEGATLTGAGTESGQIVATDRFGTATTLSTPVAYALSRPVLVSSTATPASTTRAGRLTLVFDAATPLPPSVTADGLLVLLEQTSGATYEYAYKPDGATTDVAAAVHAADAAGNALDAAVTLPVDLAPPGVAGDFEVHAAIGRSARATFACTEAATFELGPGALATGTCAPGTPVTTGSFVAPPPGSPLVLHLVDEAGNAADVAPTAELFDEPLAVYDGLMRRAGDTFALDEGGNLTTEDGTGQVAAADGRTLDFTAATGDENAPAAVRLGRLDRLPTGARAVPFSVGGQTAFGVVEALGYAPRLTVFTLDGHAATAHSSFDADLAPVAYDESLHAWVVREGDRLLAEGVDLHAEAPFPAALLSATLVDAASCGGRYVLVAQASSQLSTWAGTLPGLGDFGPVQTQSLGAGATVRLTCDGATPVELVSDGSSMQTSTLAAGAGGWKAAAGGPSPRTAFCAGPDGLFGAGRSVGGVALTDAWRFSNGSWSRLSAAPARTNCSLVVDQGEVVALGGAPASGSPGDVAAVVRASDPPGYDGEAHPPALVPAATAIDGAAGTVTLADQGAVWRWTADAGWSRTTQPAGLERPGQAAVDLANGTLFAGGGAGSDATVATLFDGTTSTSQTALLAPVGPAALVPLGSGLSLLWGESGAGSPVVEARAAAGGWSPVAPSGLAPDLATQRIFPTAPASTTVHLVQKSGAATTVADATLQAGQLVFAQKFTFAPGADALPLDFLGGGLVALPGANGGPTTVGGYGAATVAGDLTGVRLDRPAFVDAGAREALFADVANGLSTAVSDEPVPFFAAQPSTAVPAGSMQATVCASTQVGGGAAAAKARVYVVDRSGVVTAETPGTPSGGCEPFVFRFPVDGAVPPFVVVAADSGAGATGATVHLDQLVLSQVTP